jgi:hypothetical protein
LPKKVNIIVAWCLINLEIYFSISFTSKDPEYRRLHDITNVFFQLGDKLALIEFVPILRVPLFQYVNRFRQNTENYKSFIRDNFDTHLDTYTPGVIRDFSDALIAAKLETIDGNHESAQYLTDRVINKSFIFNLIIIFVAMSVQNIALALWDVFVTATDDTQFTYNWMILLLANCPHIQQTVRQEIDDKIGDRLAIHEDLNECHYINAFISEALRYRNANPLGVPHKTLEDTDIGIEL